MLKNLHVKKGIQLVIGLIFGIFFGFLLQKGQVTKYDVIIGQLLLTDFTVVKVMLSAVITGMLGVYFLRGIGLAKLRIKPGSIGKSVIGGLIFGVGFALLGYCPGTMMGAIGEGSLDALFGGVIGMFIGTWIFAAIYPHLEKTILNKGDFGDITLPELFKVNQWFVVIPVAITLTALLVWIEKAGF
ncbi:MAG: YeeE/YedE thiosulfate transporter family protein [bacterium]